MTPIWAIVSPTGRILTDTKFTTEDEAWRIGLAFTGTPDPEAIEHAKQRGYSAVQFVQVEEPAKPYPLDAFLAASDAVGSWLSAALEDEKVCPEMKTDINNWFDALGKLNA